MKRKFKQWLSTVPPILTKRTISHLSSPIIEQDVTYDVENPDLGLGQAKNMAV